ncbi:MAG: phosphate ABC transporter substrate-binding protein PstS family protein [Firmicutes bacterium]|nr:phosphate ABC transporter substrate-binding protein PstS family protein [Bacillota bacterium]
MNIQKKAISNLIRITVLSVSAFLLCSFMGCGGVSADTNGSDGDMHRSHIVVAGSTSVQPYAELLAEAYEKQYRGVKIDVTGGGSGAGIMSVQNGNAAIGMSSRDLKPAEQALLWPAVEIAKDGLAVIVHPKNPVWETGLTMSQIRDIYMGKIRNWDELSGFGDWKARTARRHAEIHVITREDGSGSRGAFQELVMGKGADGKDNRIKSKAIVQNSNGAIRYLVADNPHAIGFVSLALVEVKEAGEKEVKALALDGVDATPENVKTGTYKLSRPFLFITKDEPKGLAKEFIDFVLSSEGKKILEKEELIVG